MDDLRILSHNFIIYWHDCTLFHTITRDHLNDRIDIGNGDIICIPDAAMEKIKNELEERLYVDTTSVVNMRYQSWLKMKF